MKRSRFTDEQILAIVKEGERGRKVVDLSEPRHHRADVLPLEGEGQGMEVREWQRLQAHAAVRPRKRLTRGGALADGASASCLEEGGSCRQSRSPHASPHWNVDGLLVLHRQLDRSNLGVVSFLGVAETAIRQPQDAGTMSAIAAILTAFISSCPIDTVGVPSNLPPLSTHTRRL
jgi:hypothetical protein